MVHAPSALSAEASTIGSVAASAFDPHRPRSEGRLRSAELALCREAGISLAFDPVQQGWVPLECEDDFEIEPGIPHGLDEDVLRTRLREEARALLRDATRNARGASDTADAIWALPAQLVGSIEGPAADARLALLRALQAEAHALLADRLPGEPSRARRRHEALVEGHAYLLRSWQPSETARFRALLDDPEMWRHLPEDYPDPLDESLARDLITVSNDGTHHEVRAVEHEGEVKGQIRLLFEGSWNTADAGGLDAEISYWFGRDYWGRGLARDVIPLFTLLAFRKRPLASIFARVAEGNVASRKALESAGYRDEGDLSCALRGEQDMRVYRAYRADYLDPEPRVTQRPPAPTVEKVDVPGSTARA